MEIQTSETLNIDCDGNEFEAQNIEDELMEENVELMMRVQRVCRF